MGLDMFLTKKIYVGANYEHMNVTGKIEIKVGDKPLKVDFKKVTYIEEEAGYWRKANAIHQWFVRNVQGGEDDCKNYYVSREQLQELLNIVNNVLEASVLVDGVVANGETFVGNEFKPNFETGKMIVDPKVAHELLPTTDGFFFGSTDYDQWYFEDLKLTKEIL